MDRSTKTKLVAGAVGALVLGVAVGAAGAIAATRALSGDEQPAAADDGVPRLYHDFGPRGDFGAPGRFDEGGPNVHPGVFGGLEAAATYLGLSEEELVEALRDGKTLAELAEDEGKTVAGLVDAIVAAAEERIDEAVEDGRLDVEDAVELKAELEESITELVEGELPELPFGGPRFHFGPSWFERDPGDRGPRA
jgi:hypothetical protein